MVFDDIRRYAYERGKQDYQKNVLFDTKEPLAKPESKPAHNVEPARVLTPSGQVAEISYSTSERTILEDAHPLCDVAYTVQAPKASRKQPSQ
jgi:hypothetical protein